MLNALCFTGFLRDGGIPTISLALKVDENHNFMDSSNTKLPFHKLEDHLNDEQVQSDLIKRLLKDAIPVYDSEVEEVDGEQQDERKLSGSGSGSGDNNGSGSGDNNGSGSGDGDGDNFNIHPFLYDPTSLSLKYTRCQSIESYSGNNYYNYYNKYKSSDVMQNKEFALFRLCPSNRCNANHQYGCGYSSKGDQSNYGEYMIELSSFLEAMKEYRYTKQYSWCAYCKKCVMNQQIYENSQAAMANNDDGGNANQANYYKPCNDYAMCEDYANVCNNGNDNDNKYAKSADSYLSCSQLVGYDSSGNFMRLYAGPMCSPVSGDSSKIKLGLYYDKYCTSYAGDTYDLSDFSSGKLKSSSVTRDFYDHGCVSCDKSNIPYYSSYGNNNNYGSSVLEMCENVYYYAAKCEDNLSVAQSTSYSYGGYSSYVSEEQKKMTCDFIDNVAMGVYNEKGQIYLDQKSYSKNLIRSR